MGILLDVLTGTLLGQHALGLSIVAYIAVELHQRLRLFPLWQQSLTVLVMLLLERLLALWMAGAAGHPAPSLWYWAAPVSGMVLWPWVYLLLRFLRVLKEMVNGVAASVRLEQPDGTLRVVGSTSSNWSKPNQNHGSSCQFRKTMKSGSSGLP